MDQHALALLKVAESWDWYKTYRVQASGTRSGQLFAITPKLLSGFISESQHLGGTLLDQFWAVVSLCDPILAANVATLRNMPFRSETHTETVLFMDIDRSSVDFDPIFKMGAELFTHLGIAIMNPGRRKSGSGTPCSVSDTISLETDKLLALAAEEGFRNGKQAALKALYGTVVQILKRDGISCRFTGTAFNPNGIRPILAHLIPNSVSGKPDTMECIVMFAGTQVRDLVFQQLNQLSNLMNIQSDAHTAYYELLWGIEGRVENGTA